MSQSRMENFVPRFDITGKIAYKEYKKDLQMKEIGKFPSPIKYNHTIPFKAKKDFLIPK